VRLFGDWCEVCRRPQWVNGMGEHECGWFRALAWKPNWWLMVLFGSWRKRRGGRAWRWLKGKLRSLANTWAFVGKVGREPRDL